MDHANGGIQPQVDARTVAALEQLLARAKHGTVRTVGVIAVTAQGTIEPILAGNHGLEVYLGADLLKSRIVDGMASPQPAHALRRL